MTIGFLKENRDKLFDASVAKISADSVKILLDCGAIGVINPENVDPPFSR